MAKDLLVRSSLGPTLVNPKIYQNVLKHAHIAKPIPTTTILLVIGPAAPENGDHHHTLCHYQTTTPTAINHQPNHPSQSCTASSTAPTCLATVSSLLRGCFVRNDSGIWCR